MNVLTILRSVEELLYEVISWLFFYPRTLWMTLTRPLRTMQYSDREQRDKPDKQYLLTLSPPLFLVLSILLAHGLELALGLPVADGRTAFGRFIDHNDQTLLGFRALLFSLYALVFAWLALRLSNKRIDRETLREPFFAQCYLAGTTAILISLGGIGIRYDSNIASVAGMVVIVLSTVWYLGVEWRWLRTQADIGRWRCAGLAVAGYTAASSVVMGLGLAVI